MYVTSGALAQGAILAGGIAMGLAATTVGPGWRNPWLSIPDILTGIALFALSAYTLPRHRGVAALAALTGAAWFAGTAFAVALYWHRGPLAHLLLAYPGARVDSRSTAIVIAAGYAVAALPVVWGTDTAAAVLAIGLSVVVLLSWARSNGRRRTFRLRALVATSVFAGVVLTGIAANTLVGPQSAALPVLLGYECVLVGIAVLLGFGVRPPRQEMIADLVVDLAGQGPASARDSLARVVGDASLRVGYRSDPAGTFEDSQGGVLALPDDTGDTVTFMIEPPDRPAIAIVHEPGSLDDPGVRAGVADAALILVENARLRREAQDRVAAVEASRRRLIGASDRERRRLSRQIEATVRRRIVEVRDDIKTLIDDRQDVTDGEDLAAAASLLDDTRAVIDRAIVGLHPENLDAGLSAALQTLADRNPFPVIVRGVAPTCPPVTATAAYYACLEAVTNAAKYAPGAKVQVTVAAAHDHLHITITDDGPGGADSARGTGLVGVADRIAAAGGSLTVVSPSGEGTRILIDLPL